MQYVVVLDIDPSEFDGDDSIERACRLANAALDIGKRVTGSITVRPLSEVIAA